MTGEWPEQLVDHENRDRADDRWTNLRLATDAQNQANSVRFNTHGLKGVAIDRRRKVRPFFAQIRVKRKTVFLGFFETPEAAHARYMEAAREHYGEFARA